MSLEKLGRYDLLRVLGKGAMGLVYEGRDPNLDRRVAIKTIKVENLTQEEAAEYEVRFRVEARSAARLQHPNIVSVYDSDRDIDIAYLVMEFVQGDDLKHHLDKGERYTLEQSVGIMNDLLAALDYAHRQNVVHRDVKPANLLIEPSGRVKLTDFGVARIQDSGEATRTQGTMVGTLKYMSPEQVQGLAIDSRSDLFAAGIVLYQLLTGRRPFDGVSDYDIIQQIISKPAAPPSTYSPHLPPQIDAVIAKALEKSKENRFPTAQEFGAALQAAAQMALDTTIAPPTVRAPAGPNATWTSTMVAGESLVGTGTGSNSGVSVPTSTVTQEVELVYWKEVKDSVDVDDIHEFLAKFPTGIYADLARRRLKRLAVADEGSSGSQSGTRTRLITAPAPAKPAPLAMESGLAAEQSSSLPMSPTVDAVSSPTESSPKVVQPPAGNPSKPKVPETGKPPTSKSPMAVWAMAGLAAVVVLGVGVKMLVAKPASEVPPVMESPKVETPSEVAAPIAAPPPVLTSSGPADLAKTEPTSIAKVVPGSPASSVPSARKNAQPGSSVDKSGVALPAKPVPMPQPMPLPIVASDPSNDPQSGKPATPPKAAGERVSGDDPRKECEGRWLLSFNICMSEQCAKPHFKEHAICVERRAMEKKNTETELRGR